MMKYVIVHPDHFSSPGSAFFIGFLCMWNILIAEYQNLWITLTFDDYTKLLASFITFRIQQQIPMMFLESKKESCLKPTTGYISSRPLNIARRKWRKVVDIKYNKGCGRYIIELLYLLSHTIYVTLHFYFCPFLVLIYPIMIYGFYPPKEEWNLQIEISVIKLKL